MTERSHSPIAVTGPKAPMAHAREHKENLKYTHASNTGMLLTDVNPSLEIETHTHLPKEIAGEPRCRRQGNAEAQACSDAG